MQMELWKVAALAGLTLIVVPALLSLFAHSDVQRARRVVNTRSVLSEGAKERLLRECPSYSYTDGRHDAHPTPDIPVRDIPWLERELQHGVTDIVERIASEFRVSASDLWLRDLFLVRYVPDGQRGVGEHADMSLFSFVIQVSDLVPGEGTRFSDSGRLERANPGCAISFCGARKHRGVRLKTDEPRVIITGFVDVVPGMRPGFLVANPWIERRRCPEIFRPFLLWNLRKMQSETGLGAAALASAVAGGRYLPEQTGFREALLSLGSPPPSDVRDLSSRLAGAYAKNIKRACPS